MTRSRAVILALLAAAAGVTGLLATAAQASRATSVAPMAGEAVDLDAVTRIRSEGFHHSQVMTTLGYLCDRIGPRLTGSAELKEANEWTLSQLAGWGLANAHLEGWTFGRGWSFRSAVVRMVVPRETQLAAIPLAWTPGTEGEVRGEVVRLNVDSEAGLDAYRGKLAGKVVLLDAARDVAALAAAPARPRRLSDAALDELAQWRSTPAGLTPERRARRLQSQLRRAERKFLVQEKALASIEASPLPWGIIRVAGGGPIKEDDPPAPTGLVMAAEPYNRLLRLLDDGQKVEVAIDVQARYETGDPLAYNTVAELPGSDPAGELVMVGAHLDSWHSGTGATDNGAGSAVAMEAMRILAALHVKPRRTIRVALWTGEEEGLLGSDAYVGRHFAAPAHPPTLPPGMPAFMAEPEGPLHFQPEYRKLSAYFNLDNGSGRVRGIYAEENVAAAPIFAAWLAPLADLGASTVTLRSTGSTDHVSFNRVGLPGFQFIQDELDYDNYTHHTNMDVYDHLDGDDLEQASVVVAAFLYEAATRRDMLPRKPLRLTAPAAPAPAALSAAPAPAAKPTPAAAPAAKGPTPPTPPNTGGR